MSKALAMVEYLTVSTGITAADSMVKTADVELIEAHVVCPGKYIALITGELSAVSAAVDAVKANYPSKLVANPSTLFQQYYHKFQLQMFLDHHSTHSYYQELVYL